jgi:hypothetical protein
MKPHEMMKAEAAEVVKGKTSPPKKLENSEG